MLDRHIKSHPRYKKDPFLVVSVNDSAIDEKESNIEEYLKTRDMSHLKLNGPATIFHLKLLTASAFTTMVETAVKLSSGNISNGLLYKSFLSACLLKVENLIAVDEDGNTREVATVECPRVKPNEWLSFVEDKFFNEYFGNCPTTLEEIGKVAFERHFLAEGTWSTFRR